MCFTNTSPTASWKSTFLASDPWTTPPEYSALIGFSLLMLMGDLLHVFNLGTAKDAAGCILKVILSDTKIFRGSNIEMRMQEATESLKRFAKSRKFVLRMKKLTKNKIKWKSKTYPELGSSGYDVHVVSAWLEELLTTHALDEYKDYTVLLWSGNHAMRLVYAAGRFLTDEEHSTLKILGRTYIDTFLSLASNALANREFLWRIRPKLHLLHHLTDSVRKINPSLYATWMDEDFLKKMSKTLRLTSVKTAQERILQRWLMCTPSNLLKSKGVRSNRCA